MSSGPSSREELGGGGVGNDHLVLEREAQQLLVKPARPVEIGHGKPTWLTTVMVRPTVTNVVSDSGRD